MRRAEAHFVECMPIGGGAATVGEYPTLQELTAEEIPDAPEEPEVTDAVTAVSNYAELQAMTGAGKYYLTTDIDLTGVDWTPIATTASGFVLDGKDYTISNLTIDAAASDYQGLFSTLAEDSQIYDINFTDCSVTGDDNIGILFGRMNVSGTLTLKNITFTDCTVVGYSAGIISGYIDGLTDGDMYNCNAINCSVTGAHYSGGLIGAIYLNSGATDIFYITSCTYTGGSITFTDCDNSGGIVGESEGIATYFFNYHSCYCTTNLAITNTSRSPAHIGGFVGYSIRSSYTSCYATGDVNLTTSETNTSIGGFFGKLSTAIDGAVINCYSTGDVLIETTNNNLDNLIGSFIGEMNNSDGLHLLRCYSTGNVTLTRTEGNTWLGVGGFIGYVSNGSGDTAIIERCWSEGDVYIDDEDSAYWKDYTDVVGGCVGAFIGLYENFSAIERTDLTIQNCYAWGSITTGNADDHSARAGLIGFVDNKYDAPTVVITNVYCAQTDTAAGSDYTDQITEGTYSGGLIAYQDDDYGTLTATSCYWDNETSKISTSLIGESKTTAWLQTKANYEAAGWDFDTIWVLTETDTTTGTAGGPVRLIDYEYSTEIVYVVELGDGYMRFYKEAD